MAFHVTRSNSTPDSWDVLKDDQVVFSSTSEDQVIAYLRESGVFPPADQGPKQWQPWEPLTASEIERVIFLEAELKGPARRTPAACLRIIGREPFEIEALARVSEREADGICELRRYGWSYRKISELTGRNVNTIAKLITDDMQGGRRSDKKWRCRECGALNLLDGCETCRINRLANSRRLNIRDAKRHALEWYRKQNNRPTRHPK